MRILCLWFVLVQAGCAFISEDEAKDRKARDFRIEGLTVDRSVAIGCNQALEIVGQAVLPKSFVGSTVQPVLIVGGERVEREAAVLTADGDVAVYAFVGTLPPQDCAAGSVCTVEVVLELTLDDAVVAEEASLAITGSPSPEYGPGRLVGSNGALVDAVPVIDVNDYPALSVAVVESLWSDGDLPAPDVAFYTCEAGNPPAQGACLELPGQYLDGVMEMATGPAADFVCGVRSEEIPPYDVWVVANLPCGPATPVRVLEAVRFVDGDDCDRDGSGAEDCRPFDGAVTEEDCDQDGDGLLSELLGGLDCDDSRASVFPGAMEACDGLDTDCDPETEAGGGEADADGDGFLPCGSYLAAVPAVPGVAGGDDCAPSDADAFPGAAELDDVDACMLDKDGDGWGARLPGGSIATGTDCDDGDASLTPTLFFVDADGDGAAGPNNQFGCEGDPGLFLEETDCDDLDPSFTDLRSWFVDADSDGYGSLESALACHPPVGSVATSDDCDDADASRNPETLWYSDEDGDGFGGAEHPSSPQCEDLIGALRSSDDCDDLLFEFKPGVIEWVDSLVGTSFVPGIGTAVDVLDDDAVLTVCGTFEGQVVVYGARVTLQGFDETAAVDAMGLGRTITLLGVDPVVRDLTIRGGFDENAGGGVLLGVGVGGTLERVHVTQNEAGAGAGVVVVTGASIVDSIIDYNFGADVGAGLFVVGALEGGGAVVQYGRVTLCGSSVMNNSTVGVSYAGIADIGEQAFVGPGGTLLSEDSEWAGGAYGLSTWLESAPPFTSYPTSYDPSTLGDPFYCDAGGCQSPGAAYSVSLMPQCP